MNNRIEEHKLRTKIKGGNIQLSYREVIGIDVSHRQRSGRVYQEEMSGYNKSLYTILQSSHRYVPIEEKQLHQTISTTEKVGGQQTEHVVILSSFCLLLIVRMIVLKHKCKKKSKDHDRLFMEKDDFQQQTNLEIKRKLEENLKLQHQNKYLEQQISEQVQAQKEELLKLQMEYEKMQKEALVEALRMERKDRLLDLLGEKLKSFEDLGNVRSLERMIKDEMRLDEVVRQSVREFQDIIPDFFQRLKELSKNKLSALELKYCAYMYLNLTTRDIAAAFHIEPSSVRVTKYRIKQKLWLSREDDLESFVQKLV